MDDETLIEVLNIYLSLRKLGPQAMQKLLAATRGKYSFEIVCKAVVGNSLNKSNEILLIRNYPELLEDYLKGNPRCNFLESEEVEEISKEAGLGEIVDKFPRPVINEARNSLADFFPKGFKI